MVDTSIIINKTVYRDGGSIGFTLDNGMLLVIDNRISTDTRGSVWHGYPDKSDSTLVVSKYLLQLVQKKLQE